MVNRNEYIGPWAEGTMHLTCKNGHEWSVRAEHSKNADRWNILPPNKQADAHCPECGELHDTRSFEQEIG